MAANEMQFEELGQQYGRKLDKISKTLRHTRNGILAVVLVIIVCTFLCLIYIRPASTPEFGGLAVLISVLWLIPSAMFYKHIRDKSKKVIIEVAQATNEAHKEAVALIQDTQSNGSLTPQPKPQHTSMSLIKELESVLKNKRIE